MKNRRSTQLLLAAAAIAAPALLTACGTESTATTDDVAGGAPTTSVAAPTDTAEGGVSRTHLLTDADTVYAPGWADWFRLAAGDEDLGGQGDLAHPCLVDGLGATGATTVVRADFELRNLKDGAPSVRGDLMTQLVAEYDDEAAATKAWSTVNRRLQECDGRPEAITDYSALQTRKVVVPGTDAVITDSHYGPVPKALDPHDVSAYIMETGVLRAGNRLTVLTSVIVGQDYNFLDGTPVEKMLVPAAERLQG